ncbi:hypothetical protein, partial [Bradyrhizobium ottawaense]|uniref:hypothetical protein n=1 Tax=Bradyrhizobium ottawaense TaxID=931866 RepID=UPI0030C72960
FQTNHRSRNVLSRRRRSARVFKILRQVRLRNTSEDHSGDSSNSRFAAALVEQTLAVRDNHAAASIDAATLKDALQ